MNIWSTIQQALNDEGLDAGPVDGVPGRRTIGALKAYQRRHGFPETGQPDQRTLSMLLRHVPVIPPGTGQTPWLTVAKSLIGTREVPGPSSNKDILSWGKQLDIDYPDDDIPWCGLFVAHCVSLTLPKEPLPSNPLGARNWNRFGIPMQRPAVGAIAVFWREFRQGYKGHVAFYISEDATSFTILGGNQQNSVSYTRISKDRLLGFRWPATAMKPLDGPLYAEGVGHLSTDES